MNPPFATEVDAEGVTLTFTAPVTRLRLSADDLSALFGDVYLATLRDWSRTLCERIAGGEDPSVDANREWAAFEGAHAHEVGGEGG